MKSLYPGQKVSSVQVVFDFLAAHAINLAKELADIFDMRRHAKRAVQPRAWISNACISLNYVITYCNTAYVNFS